MIEPYIARVLDTLALDPILEGRVRAFLRRDLPRRRGELDLPTSEHRASGIAPDDLAYHLFYPEAGPRTLRYIALVPLLIILVPLMLADSLGNAAVVLLVAISVELAQLIIQRGRFPASLENDAVQTSTVEFGVHTIERIGLAPRHLFSAPILIQYAGGRLDCPRGAPWTLLLASQLVRRLEGRVPIDPAVREFLARAPLPLQRKQRWARVYRGFMMMVGAALIALAFVMSGVGFSPLALIAPVALTLLMLLFGNFRLMIRTELEAVSSLIACAFAAMAWFMAVAFIEGAGLAAVGALAGAGAFLLFLASLPFSALRVDWRRVAAGFGAAAAVWGAATFYFHQAYERPEFLFGYGQGEIRLGVELREGGHIFTAMRRIPQKTEEDPTDARNLNTVFVWRAGQPPDQIAELRSAAFSVPIWIRDTQELLFTSPGPDGFLTLRYLAASGGGERAVDMLYESPRRLFIGLASYQPSLDGSHVWLEDARGADTTRFVIRRVADSRDVWSGVSANPLASAPAFVLLGWRNGHSALLLHFTRDDDPLPGFEQHDAAWLDARIAIHDTAVGTSNMLARLPAPVIDHQYFREQGFLLTLTPEFDMQITHLDTGMSDIFPNPHFIAFQAFDRFQWAADEGALYTLGAEAARPEEPYANPPLDRIIRLDPATGEQRLLWSSSQPIRDMWVPPDGRYFLVLMESPLRPFGYAAVNVYALDAATGELRRLGPWNRVAVHRLTAPDHSFDLPLAEYPRAWILPQPEVRLRFRSMGGAMFRHPNPFAVN